MEIKLTLSNEDMDRILEMSGYVTEEVKLWYNTWVDYYHGSNVWHNALEMECLSPINEVVAYKMGERPETLEGEHPRLEQNEEHKINNVVQRLFKERLMKIMF